MLQWKGATLQGSGGLTNQGFLTIAGNAALIQTALTNAGTITHAGGTIAMANSTLTNVAGAFYDLAGDGLGLSTDDSSLQNFGTFRKSVGTGTDTINVPINNSGTVEADAGTLALAKGASQVSGSTLTGGTWSVSGGATLTISSAGSFTTNNGTVTLSGPGSTFTNLTGLAVNAGNFSLLAGRSFTTAGDLSNNGTVTVGPGSTLTVNGNYAQGVNATLDVRLGGPSAGGQLTATGTAALNGTLKAELVNGYNPTVGDSLTVARYQNNNNSNFATFQLPSTGGVSFSAATSSSHVVLNAQVVAGSGLVVSGTGGNDTLIVTATNADSGTFSLNGGPATPFSGVASFAFHGGGGTDLFILHNPASGRFAPGGGIRFDTAGNFPGNALVLDGGGSGFVEDFESDPASGNSTLFAGDGTLNQVVSLAGVPNITDTASANSLTVHDATDAANSVVLDDGATPGAGRNRVRLDASAFEFANKGTLVINSGLTAGDQGKSLILASNKAAGGLGTVLVNGGAGNDIVFVRSTAAGTTTQVNAGGGDDTLLVSSVPGTLDTFAGKLTLDAGPGTNALYVISTGRSAADSVVLTDSFVGSGVVPFLVNYRAGGGTFGRGVLFLTGSGDNLVSIWSTLAGGPTFVFGGAGNDTFFVTAPDGGALTRLAGTLVVDGGAGANALEVTEAASATADTLFATGNALISTANGFAVVYTATGGDFSRGVVLQTGAGDDTVLVLGQAALAPLIVFTGTGSDHVDVRTAPAQVPTPTVHGDAGNDLLTVEDVSGTAVIHEVLTGADAGTVQVLYGPATFAIPFDGIEQVLTLPALT
jgi:hypothetical protein